MNKQSRILVLGGHGFIGRHAVAALNSAGHSVTIGTRNPDAHYTTNIQRQICFEAHNCSDDWLYLTEEFDVILNCVGILRPTRIASYEQVHHLSPRYIAYACGHSTTRFIHVSALGLAANNRSGFLVSKLAGEDAIQATDAPWIIVRPSLLDGEGGYGAAWLRGVARLPFFVHPMDAQGQFAALMVTDLGLALARLCTADETDLKLTRSRYFELGGPTNYTFKSYIRALRTLHTKRRAVAIPIPGFVARLGAHICDLFSATPFSYGHWELLRRHNAPAENRLTELLGRPPAEVIK